MTDRIQSLTVVLDHDFRVDDAEHLVNAIKMIKGVADVIQGEPVNLSDEIARRRVKRRVKFQLYDAIGDVLDKEDS